MRKFISLVVLSICLAPIICFAQETITITTYYPSPFGSYNSLEANNFQADRIAIGDGNTAADPAAADYVGDGVLDLKGLAAAPVGNAGSIYYDSTVNKFFFHDGTGWISMIPEAARLIYYDTTPGGWHPCQPAGTHVVGGMTVTLEGASMARCGDGLSPPRCMPLAGYIICH